MDKKIGKRTVKLSGETKILSGFSVVGPREGEGPLKEHFDKVIEDEMFGKESYEKAESYMLLMTIRKAIESGGFDVSEIDYMFAGDLLNQIIASSFVARELEIPFFGLYGACSTIAEAISLGAVFIDNDIGKKIVCATSSHFCAAERQFRFPLEYGSQRTGTSQWTVTGAGALILGKSIKKCPKITYITTGVAKDYGIKDANNMGAAMAPAAVDTIYHHFKETGKTPTDYDYIITGDLGHVGKEIVEKLMLEYGYDIGGNYIDCGDIIFDRDRQKTCAGGSGCGCSASVFSGYFYKKMIKGEIKKIFLVATGALMSPTSALQGETIPGIAHGISIEME